MAADGAKIALWNLYRTLADLLMCVGRHRKRFEAEMARMLAFPGRLLIVEASWDEVHRGEFGRSHLTPTQVIGSLDGWQAMGIAVVMAGNRANAQQYASRVLFATAKKYWKRMRAMTFDFS